MQLISAPDACCAPPRGRCASTPLSLNDLIAQAVLIYLGDVFLTGHGSPEGVVTGVVHGQLYTDVDTGSKYTFIGIVGQNIGWV